MFYDTFEALCKDRRIAPSALASKLGMSKSSPGRWRTGSSPDLDTAKKVADFFGVTIDFLVYGEDRCSGMVNASNGSAVVQHGSGNTVSATSHEVTPEEGSQDFEGELLKLYRSLNLADKLALLQSALAMRAKEDQEGAHKIE